MRPSRLDHPTSIPKDHRLSQYATTRPQAKPADVPVASPKRRSFRPELQGLRALAVGLVLLYHLWPQRLSGGFVGVDVFFVISGFLITSHLLKQLETQGRISLASFWARRIRRLLPLAFLVLLVSAVLLFLFMPGTLWQDNLRQILASAFYVQNWFLASAAVDYSASENPDSLVTHYWSLSVEEQFYVFFPLALAVAAFLAHRYTRRGWPARRTVGLTLAVIAIGSLAYSVYFTAYDPAQAYFVTPTRLWEFCAGALLVLLPQMTRPDHWLRNLLGWAGILMIVTAALTFSDATAFPGYAALLPVVGTVLFIRFGAQSPRTGVYWWASRRPFVRLGDWSYALYLWHWPLIVVVSIVNDDFFWYHKILVAVASILLAAASQRWVEDPLRFSTLLKRPRNSFAFMAAGLALLSVVALLVPTLVLRANDQRVETQGECVGANALLNDCSDEDVFKDPVVSPAAVAAQREKRPFSECQQSETQDVTSWEPCVLGVPESESTVQAAILGDSHATMWLPVLDEIARDNQWSLRVHTKSGCIPVDREPEGSSSGDATDAKEQGCAEFVRTTTQEFIEDESLDVVLMSASRIGKDTSETASTEALHRMWSDWQDAGKEVFVFEESPHFGELDVPTCIETADDVKSDCSVSLSKATERNARLTKAVENGDPAIVGSFSSMDGVCRDDRCYGLVGGLISYYDHSHYSVEFSTSFRRSIEQALSEAGLLTAAQ
ncbi:acyltransferase family protein [Micrococcus terreus]|uniref:acyltransferase family protein n=1 Tax=Micrococcus terreus TaxID=574650 RepID=UPI0023F84DE4|nr:acyltransferase family protein [Micrococcus terreus]